MPESSGPTSPGGGSRARASMAASGNASGTSNGGLSLQTVLEMNDIPEFANEPGPGHYLNHESSGFNSIGVQRLAKNASAPEVSFPKTGWDKWNKVVISKAHEGGSKCRDSPGFAYHPKEQNLAGPSAKIGSSTRPPLSGTLGKDSPGPTYNVRDAPRAEDRLATNEESKNKAFGKAERFRMDKSGGLGPGQYDRKGELEGGTGRSFGVGRYAYKKVCTPGWETEGAGRASPGVGPPLWSDITDVGNKKGQKHPFTIGKAERFPEAKTQGFPGPGHYRQDERDVGKTSFMKNGPILTGTKRANSCCFGSKPRKPRFRILLAQLTAERGGWGYL